MDYPEDTGTMAQLARQIYEPVGERQDVDGWNYRPELSNDHLGVFFKDKQAVIAQRGTIADPRDLWEDAKIAVGLGATSAYVDENIQMARKVKEDYGLDPVFVGHSKAANHALYAGRKVRNSVVYAFNEPAPMNELLGELTRSARCGLIGGKGCKQKGNIHIFSNRRDVISDLSSFYNGTIHSADKSFGLKAHGLGSWF